MLLKLFDHSSLKEQLGKGVIYLWDFFFAPARWSANFYQGMLAGGQRYGLGEGWIQLFSLLLVTIALISFVLLNVMFLTWLERKIAGRIQMRLGPTRTGPHGLLQPVADAIKSLFKEPLILPHIDRFIYFASPMFIFTGALLSFLVIPFSPGWVVVPLEYGLIYSFAVSGISTLFVLASGWCSNNKWSLLGGMRTVAQAIGYEIPLILAGLGVALVAGTFNLNHIVDGQAGLWNIIRQPLAFLIFFVASLAELNRAPFDLEEAEQELVGGYLTEYSGMNFALLYLGEYTHLLGASALIATLFLGGWQGPWLPPIIWFMIKIYAVALFYMWIRWTYPRIRVDHLMQFNWKFLLPLALINLALTSLVLVF